MTATRKITRSCQMVLSTLAKAKGPMTRKIVAEKLEQGGTKLTEGRIPEESLTYNGLVATGDVKEMELEGETCYAITAKGRKLLAEATGEAS